jgi:hypothetical protein
LDQLYPLQPVDDIKYGLISEAGQPSDFYSRNRPMEPHSIQHNALVQQMSVFQIRPVLWLGSLLMSLHYSF